MAFVARGVALIASDGDVITGLPPGMRNLGNEALIYVVSGEGGGISFFFRPEVAGPTHSSDSTACSRGRSSSPRSRSLIAIFLLHKTQFGRHTYAIGGNREASVRAGVPADRMTILLFMLSAMHGGSRRLPRTARFTSGSSVCG